MKVVGIDEEKANDTWAEVELWRWQYGHLPDSSDTQPLDIKIATQKMAEALLEGKVQPFSAASVIKFLGRQFEAEVTEP